MSTDATRHTSRCSHDHADELAYLGNVAAENTEEIIVHTDDLEPSEHPPLPGRSVPAHPVNNPIPQSPTDAYPHWGKGDPPLPSSAIRDIFAQLSRTLGFQHDNMLNMYDHLLTMLDSRSSRMSSTLALWTLHADYIGGEHANYRKWYFVVQLGVKDTGAGKNTPSDLIQDLARQDWTKRMSTMSDTMRITQLALYLLIWGEASVLRYCPELICFLFNLADDMVTSEKAENIIVDEGWFLNGIVTPLYRFIRDQSYVVDKNGQHVRLERDHQDIIGYDDINQFFWNRQVIQHRLILHDGRVLMKNIEKHARLVALQSVDWHQAFRKTFYETRSMFHLLINFSRLWIIHATVFWYYMSANIDVWYMGRTRSTAARLSIVSLGGVVAILVTVGATLAELRYRPFNAASLRVALFRLSVLGVLAGLHIASTIFLVQTNSQSPWIIVMACMQLVAGAAVALALAIVPSAHLLWSDSHLTERTFSGQFAMMTGDDRFQSVMLWLCVFGCKFLESYFFLALSFRDAFVSVGSLYLQDCRHDRWLGRTMCVVMPVLASVLMLLVELLLFFLDTYLWYVIWSTLFSVAQAFRTGVSIMTSWKTLFARVPGQMINKITVHTFDTKAQFKVACSQMWNAIVISMYRDHLISIDHLQSLLYQLGKDGRICTPSLLNPKSNAQKRDCFPPYSEAERRLSFFAQSLSTTIPPPCPVESMPIFTVFTPHYAEKILLSLREIIREEDTTTRVTLLEYLKRLHPTEWSNFVQDTKFISEEGDSEKPMSDKDDLPFYCIGFKSSAPEYVLRTRVWASLHAQTLYRSISGFMNYARALKVLYRIEHPSVEHHEANLDQVAHHKFRFLVSMQRYASFNQEEISNCEYLLSEYPNLQIAYIDQETNADEKEPIYYSVLIDGRCEHDSKSNRRVPRYRIRLPGNPILGDGKSDNQNHALIFYRGEYLQLVDANQDNYLEECLKIRSIFGEFEHHPPSDPAAVYTLSTGDSQSQSSPVAIVGGREYIFSENIGVLGDVAAGKEQTFGTLTQRIMAKLGGRLHYGHPDFLNAVYMTTRGGVSKAQRGLHLNEDIFAGMSVLSRGGRIKHTEYLQCGKGRDLGFCSILNFTTKIGSGTGEQILSREYYYLGTQLPIDRFLTFYYAHPGFHMNNIMIIISVHVFLVCMAMIGTLAISIPTCTNERDCFRTGPVYEWLERCILSIAAVFFVAFLPLFLQELTEKGTIRSIWRLVKQFLSLSPLFEVFVTQIYANAVLSNLQFGGARYISTGRGFATSRTPFSILFSRFAVPSLYFGTRTLSILCFVTLTFWVPHLLYFWVTVLSLVISPFVFNPHQFVLIDFITDYREFLGWLSRGNGRRYSQHAWITFCRLRRARVTGHQRNLDAAMVPRAHFSSIFLSEILIPLIHAIVLVMAYVFLKTYRPDILSQGGVWSRFALVTLGPIVWNLLVLLVLQLVSLLVAVFMARAKRRIWGTYIAGIAHGLGLLGLAVVLELFWLLEDYDVRSTLLGLLAAFALQRFLFNLISVLFLTRELPHDTANRAWWTGNWWDAKLGLYGLRELVCKTVEMSLFTTDFVLGHCILFILFPVTLIPYVDRIHSMMLFWLRPSKQIRPSVLSTKQRQRRQWIALVYGPIFLLVLSCFAALVILPLKLKPFRIHQAWL